MKAGWQRIAMALSMAAAGAHGAIMQTGSDDPSSSGTSGYPQSPWSSALGARAMENSYYSAGGASGTVLHNVNLMTGQPVYSIPIGEIGSGGPARFPITLHYGGPVRPMFDADNEKGPTSWIGYGWSFTTPFVSVNHKGTASISDDVYFCNLGPYGGGQLIQDAVGNFFVSGDPTIKIVEPNQNTSGPPTKWVLQWVGGLRMEFGTREPADNASRTVNMVGSTLTGSPSAAASGIPFTYRWDISRMDDYRTDNDQGNASIEFKYDRILVPVGGGKSYTRESYIKDIVRKNRRGDEIEKYRFVLADKDISEYRTSDFEPGMGQSIYETKRLARIERYIEGSPGIDRRYVLETTLMPAAHPGFPYPKRRLQSIQAEYRNPIGFLMVDPKMKWVFGYDLAVHHYGLKTIDKPFGGRDEYFYERPTYNTAQWMDNTRQDATIHKLSRVSEGGGEQEIQLPSNYTTLSNQWENQTVCTESFCYIAVVERNPNDALHFSVWRNNGNYFKKAQDDAGYTMAKSFQSTQGYSLQIIPWNDNFIILDSKDKKLWLYEWNGQEFKLHSNLIRRGSSIGALAPIIPNAVGDWSVTLGTDYFLVHDKSFRNTCNGTVYNGHSKVYVIRKSGTEWRDLNERECFESTSCVRTDPATGNWTGSPGCLEFNTTDLTVNAGPGLIQIVHNGVYNLFSWVQTQTGSTFNFLSNRTNPGKVVQPIQYGKDYFLLSSYQNHLGYLEVMHFNGQAITKIQEYNASLVQDGTEGSQLRGYVSGDYFISTVSYQQMNPVLFWKKAVTRDANQTPVAFSFASYPISTNLVINRDDLRIKTHPSAFSIEAYPKGSIQGGLITQPPVVFNGSNYLTYLFEVDISLPGSPFRDVTSSFQNGNGKNLFDITFSAVDSKVTGTSCTQGSSSLCDGAPIDHWGLKFATAILTPRLGTSQPFIRNKADVYTPWTLSAPYPYVFSQFRISNASRIGAVSMLNRTTQKAEFVLLQSMGQGFIRYPYEIANSNPPMGDMHYVRTFKSSSNISGNNWGHWTEYGFRYGLDNLNLLEGKAEFNSHLQSFIFPVSGVTTYRGSEATTNPSSVVSQTFHHVIDEAQNPIPDPHLIRQGLATKIRIHDVDGQKGSETLGREVKMTESEFYPPANESIWPAKLFVIRPKSTTTTQWARNKSRQVNKVSYHKFYPYNNRPLFSKTKIGSDWYLSQTLFQPSGKSQGMPFGETTYRFGTEPSDASLDGWSGSVNQRFTGDNANQKAISASEAEYDLGFPYMVKKHKAWRDTDPTLDDEELKRGADPIHYLNEGWEDRLIIDKWNRFGQPLETRTILTSSPLVEKRTALFYEGRASLPVGTIENSFLEDAAILTAENGNTTLASGKHDWEERWTRNDAGYSSEVAHTGRWSIKVVDNKGPVISLRLKGVEAQGYDYVISAWVYADNTVKPIITARRYRANNSGLSSITVQDPVGAAFTPKKWQRYEIRFTNAQLRGSENLFTGENSNDYLMVQVGTGNTLGVSTRIVYVDDIVCRPVQSLANLSAYDAKGQLIHSTNNAHMTSTFEYDLFGSLTATRDDENRIFNSTANHAPGEND